MRNIEQTRADILDAAWDLISVEGADASLARIAKAAGITRQSVYDHFGSRGGMIVAMVRRVDERLEIKERLFTAFQEPNPHARVKKTIDVWTAFVQEIYSVASDLIRLRATDRDAASAWEDRMSELRQWLLDLAKTLKREGALQPHWTAKSASEYLWSSFSVQIWGLFTEDCGWTNNQARAVLRRTIPQTLLVAEIQDSSERNKQSKT
jgi:AcrR family transcriptional regulator